MPGLDEGFGHHDAGAGDGYTRDDHGRMLAIDGAEHHLPSHCVRGAPGIPRNALRERHFASRGVGREGQGGLVRGVYFSPKIGHLHDGNSSLQLQYRGRENWFRTWEKFLLFNSYQSSLACDRGTKTYLSLPRLSPFSKAS